MSRLAVSGSIYYLFFAYLTNWLTGFGGNAKLPRHQFVDKNHIFVSKKQVQISENLNHEDVMREAIKLYNANEISRCRRRNLAGLVQLARGRIIAGFRPSEKDGGPNEKMFVCQEPDVITEEEILR